MECCYVVEIWGEEAKRRALRVLEEGMDGQLSAQQSNPINAPCDVRSSQSDVNIISGSDGQSGSGCIEHVPETN